MPLKVDKEKCTGCEICIQVCPFNAISIVDGSIIIHDNCTECNICVEECVEKAIWKVTAEGEAIEDLSTYRNIWVFAEAGNLGLKDSTRQALSQARRLASDIGGKVEAVLLGHRIGNSAEELASVGADVVYAIDHPLLESYDCEVYAKALLDLIRERKPEIFLFGSTPWALDLAPRIAQDLGTGLATNCTKLEIDNERRLIQIRPIFGGRFIAKVVTSKRPQMAIISPEASWQLEGGVVRRGKIVQIDPRISETMRRTRILSSSTVI